MRLVRVLGAGLVVAACSSSGSSGTAGHRGSDGGQLGTGGGGSGDSGGPSEGATFLTDYATAVCEMYEPCCQAEGLGYDRAGCIEWFRKVTAAVARGDYRPEEGEACLAELNAARAADRDRCSTALNFGDATFEMDCLEAFGPAKREGKALGETCLSASECTSSGQEDGQVICDGRCVLQHRGKAGEGPCSLQGSDAGAEVFQCLSADDLYCQRDDNVCAKRVAPGALCPFPGACNADGYCRGGRCEPLGAPGEPCAGAVPGAGGFCRAGSACDVATLTCGAPRAEGATCRDSTECASGACRNGKCDQPEFTRSLNCTGKN